MTCSESSAIQTVFLRASPPELHGPGNLRAAKEARVVAWLPALGKRWDRSERDWTASGGSGNVKPFLGIDRRDLRARSPQGHG